MTLLMWDKPARAKTPEEWALSGGFEDGPTGGYVPNMSDADAKRWKAKLKGTRTGYPQVEIRKTIGATQMTIIVNLGDGYTYKGLTPQGSGWMGSTKGINVHLSLNGAAQMTFEVMSEMHRAVDEARAFLEARAEEARIEASIPQIAARLTPDQRDGILNGECGVPKRRDEWSSDCICAAAACEELQAMDPPLAYPRGTFPAGIVRTPIGEKVRDHLRAEIKKAGAKK